jgi:hypothetical protein
MSTKMTNLDELRSEIEELKILFKNNPRDEKIKEYFIKHYFNLDVLDLGSVEFDIQMDLLIEEIDNLIVWLVEK